jgi:regulator of sirC expression with transglutaminase-like and TPR domain
MTAPLVDELQRVLAREPIDLARAALVVAKLEYPRLDPAPHLAVLQDLGDRAAARLSRVRGISTRPRVAALNMLLFEDERFSGNHAHYDDFRNSLINVVLERRLGIPITLALVYIEVARRAGLTVQGISFPGHFLMRVPSPPLSSHGPRTAHDDEELILDPFDAGLELDEADCRRLLARHLGSATEDTPFDPALLRPCSPRHMLARMLNNLKRTYVEMRSFPQARMVTNLLLAVEPMLLSELRDRGLLAYHLDDYPAALRDLEDYLRLSNWKDSEDPEEREQILEHVKTLRRRVAGLN